MDLTSEPNQETTGEIKDGDRSMSGIIDAPRKEDMPDLLRLDSVVDINGGPRAVTTQIRTPSPSGPISESANEDQLMQSKMSNRDPNLQHNGPVAADPKKKIPVESLSKEELIVQTKRQMSLLQKMKAKYDDLQKKFTDLEDQQQQTRSVEASADLSNILRDKIATLEQDLRQERDLHRKAKDQAAKSAQNSVAELELRDYQRTIAQLNEKVTAKDDCILRITEQLHSSEQMLVTKHRTIQEQTVKIEELTEKNGRLEASLSDAHRNSLERERTIASLRDDVTALNEQVRNLEVTLGSNTDQQSDLVRSFAQLQQSMEGKERVLQQKNAEISRLSVDLSHARTQHDHVIRDFEDYKVRAQTLLRQKDNVTETAQRQRELEELVLRVTELDGELETSRRKLVEAEEDLRKEKWESEAAKRAFDAEKIRWEKALLEGEFKSRSLETSQESTYQEHRRKIKAYEAEITCLKDLHGSTNEKLLDELRLLRLQNEELRREASSVDKTAETSLDEVHLIRRKSEEYPPVRSRSNSSHSSPISELPSSIFNRTISVSASENALLQHQQPLEKLISFPLQNTMATTSAKDIDQRRMAHLSELLHESESTNVRLNDQIRLLKTELRRLEANFERDKHANSMEYLKNVLMQFLTHRVAASEQEKLIEVMTTILKLTVEERQQLMKSASASYIPDNIKSWGTYLNPWKAKDGT